MASPEFYRLVERIRARRPTAPRSVAEMRAEMELVGQRFQPPKGVRFAAAEAGGVPAEWVVPSDPGSAGAILYFHGGGYSIGSIASHRHLVGHIAEAAGTRALSLGYRLAPEHPFPAAVEDAAAAARWLRGQGIDPRRTVFAGDSAGGGLALAACLALRDAGDPLPAAAVCLSPLTDLTLEAPSIRGRAALDPMVQPDSTIAYVRRYIGDEGDPKAPLASPLHADLRGLPPLLILVGTWEILLDDSTGLAERARAAGVAVDLRIGEEMIHVWPYYADMIPEGRAAIGEIGRYIRDRLDLK
jgi:epsilon-lactone hydrolase